jgi:hypothetical protein
MQTTACQKQLWRIFIDGQTLAFGMAHGKQYNFLAGYASGVTL